MSWETTSILLGLLVPITVALIKFLPSRSNSQGLETEIAVIEVKIQQLAKGQEELKASVENLLKHVMDLTSIIRERK